MTKYQVGAVWYNAATNDYVRFNNGPFLLNTIATIIDTTGLQKGSNSFWLIPVANAIEWEQRQ